MSDQKIVRDIQLLIAIKCYTSTFFRIVQLDHLSYISSMFWGYGWFYHLIKSRIKREADIIFYNRTFSLAFRDSGYGSYAP